MNEEDLSIDYPSRRRFLQTAALVSSVTASVQEGAAQSTPVGTLPCSLTVNEVQHDLQLDARVTLLDLLREQLHLTGTKKGCDHGQCGACTVIANGVRINSCLALAMKYDGQKITTIEGLATGERLHPMQASFLENDGFQCGFCTSGQICSAVAMLEEVRSGAPSLVTPKGASVVELTDEEIKERMAGNLCRCGAYPNIVASIRFVSEQGGRRS